MSQKLFSFEDDLVHTCHCNEHMPPGPCLACEKEKKEYDDAPASVPDWRRGLIDQIRRDMETLRGPNIDDDPCGRKFYEDRIASYRASLTE